MNQNPVQRSSVPAWRWRSMGWIWGNSFMSSQNPWNGFSLVVGIPGDYSTTMWWQWFCLGRQHFGFVREFWCLNKPIKTQYQSCWGISSSIYQEKDVTWNKNSEEAQSGGSDGPVPCAHSHWLNTFLCLHDLMEESQRTPFLTAFDTLSLNNMQQGTCLGWQGEDARERKKLFLWFQWGFLAVILQEQRSLPGCWCKLSVMIYPHTVTLPSWLFVPDAVHKLFTVLVLESASLST